MYLSIFAKYDALINGGTSDFKYAVMQDVLEQPAPSFYLNPSSAVVFYYRAMAQHRKLCRESSRHASL
ncbi:MAG: hypothetical protein IJQ84_05920 [Paludibacteraceae bacterium]|nr:hypothetical protein [Paludibacteraceae bacterium]MBR0065389.1 hypothetical protein [Paludibacteraceae bacterium]